MRATRGRLQSLRRRKALARRRQTFIARGASKRVAARATQRSGFLESLVHETGRILWRRCAGGCACPRKRRVINAPLQGDADEENADRAFGKKNQLVVSVRKAVFLSVMARRS